MIGGCSALAAWAVRTNVNATETAGNFVELFGVEFVGLREFAGLRRDLMLFLRFGCR